MIMCIQNFGLNRSFRFQDIEQKLNCDGMTERLTERKNGGQGESSIAPLFQSGVITKKEASALYEKCSPHVH